MKLGCSLVIVVVLTSAIPLQAGQARRANPAATPPSVAQQDSGDMTPGEVQRMFDAWALVEAQDAVQLNEAQYGRFVPKMKTLQDARRRHQQARLQILGEIRKATTTQPGMAVDEGVVREKLKALRDEDERAQADLRKAFDGIDEVLDTTQQARFRLFEERMETRKLELLTRARANARARRGGAGR